MRSSRRCLKRQEKYNHLLEHSIDTIKWTKLEYKKPYYFFVPKDFKSEDKYNKWFFVSNLFKINSSWIETAKDKLIIKDSNKDINKFKKNFEELNIQELKNKYKNFKKEKLEQVKWDIKNSQIIKLSYRPLDDRFTLYSPNSWWVLWRSKDKVMNHMLINNLAFYILIYCHTKSLLTCHLNL